VKVATRLDVVVGLRERQEKEAMLSLARALTETQKARAQVDAAMERMRRDGRGGGSAAEWEIGDAAQARGLSEIEVAKEALERARAKEAEAKRVHLVAHQKAEVVRRAAQSKREERIGEMERAEAKAMDDFSSTQWARRKMFGAAR
jgi:flagellar export protein FliJ